ncbi:hypothetical protein BKA93DRAFT_853246 [Sparassis latifolia]
MLVLRATMAEARSIWPEVGAQVYPMLVLVSVSTAPWKTEGYDLRAARNCATFACDASLLRETVTLLLHAASPSLPVIHPRYCAPPHTQSLTYSIALAPPSTTRLRDYSKCCILRNLGKCVRDGRANACGILVDDLAPTRTEHSGQTARAVPLSESNNLEQMTTHPPDDPRPKFGGSFESREASQGYTGNFSGSPWKGDKLNVHTSGVVDRRQAGDRRV